MRIRVGYELIYNLPQSTPMLLTLSIHYSRASDIVIPDYLTTDPAVGVTAYRDGFGNWCSRILAPAGRIRIKGSGEVRDLRLTRPRFPFSPAAFHSRISPKRLWYSSSAAATAKRICSPRWPGSFSAACRADGRSFRQSAIT